MRRKILTEAAPVMPFYFSLRSEKRIDLHALIQGGVDRDDLRAHHDPEHADHGE